MTNPLKEAKARTQAAWDEYNRLLSEQLIINDTRRFNDPKSGARAHLNEDDVLFVDDCIKDISGFVGWLAGLLAQPAVWVTDWGTYKPREGQTRERLVGTQYVVRDWGDGYGINIYHDNGDPVYMNGNSDKFGSVEEAKAYAEKLSRMDS